MPTSNAYFYRKRIIRESFVTLEKVACFRFTERTNEPDFLAIVPLDGCYSYVGKVGGRQVLSLAPDCVADYIVWHEVMHAIGFEHEHQRPDRDDFIRVEYSNVEVGQLANFEKLSSHEVDYKEQYDYKSIMHYDSLAFGRKDRRSKRRLATMVPLRVGLCFPPL
ncbi:astacin [Oesophagostomum dentatum]|uniref:Metalloendopeptidase n=1 Tax=Oesophagostomum dentatum TaxID=61180 RepID=A0A0B1STQ2_OESDE|nr:astacin [Oesophagostomum dentatum]